MQKRSNAGKRRIATLVPLGALEAIANASEVGLTKYWQDGYREEGGYYYSDCLDSAVRHIMLRTGGEKYDAEGSAFLGRPIDHIDMALWNLAAACEIRRLYGAVNDDLWSGPGTVLTGGARITPAEAELKALADLKGRVEAYLRDVPEKYKEKVKAPAEALLRDLGAKE